MLLFILFGSTYTCERTFSRINYVKSSEIYPLIDENLHFLLRIDATRPTQDIERLVREKQAEFYTYLF
jgi:hypothetical protein